MILDNVLEVFIMDGEKEECMEKIDERLEKIEDVKFLALLYGLISESIKIREE